MKYGSVNSKMKGTKITDNRKRFSGWLLLLLLVFGTVSCMDDDLLTRVNRIDTGIDSQLGQMIRKQRGLFILNQGNFMYENASLSYYFIDSMKVLNQAFWRVNEFPLGDVAQSMAIHDSLGYIVMNNSGKILVININTFQYVGKITGMVSPRYIHFVSGKKAYVSDLHARALTIFNPETFQVTGQIPLKNSTSLFSQHPTEQMIGFGDKVFVNCWSYDNKILVIDSKTDQLIDSIDVVMQPASMVLDCNNKIWVLSDGGAPGNPMGYERPALTCIDAESHEVERVIRFNLGEAPRSLALNGTADTLFYIKGHVWRTPVVHYQPKSIVESPYQQNHSGGYFALAVDPLTSEIYLADAIDHVQQGLVYRFSAQAVPVDTFRVGIIPGGFCFRP